MVTSPASVSDDTDSANADAADAESSKAVDFKTEIRPILSNRCFACHGPDEEHVESGLKLDHVESAIAPADSGKAAIVPGDSQASELVRRVLSQDENERMPPPHFGARLTERETELLRRWIDQGANYSNHWSYELPKSTRLPVEPSAWARQFPQWHGSAIDRMLLAKLETKQWDPSPPADRRTLLRRLCLDLTGLPPTLEQQEDFLNDDSPLAIENLVDSLLASPAYGEHWGRRWLDLARYADSAGYADDPVRTIWAYRDWVIRAFNNNLPFDAFTIEQLAGDLLPNAGPDTLVATAFHRNTLTNNEGGTNDEEFRNVAVVDRVNTTMAVWMGVTMACAQCHSHKYDPISQKEYFQVFAILNQTQDADRGDESPTYSWYSPEQRQRKQELEAELDRIQKQLDAPEDGLLAEQSQWVARLRSPIAWSPLPIASVASQSGQTAEIDAQGTALLSGNPKNDKLTVQVALPEGLKAESLTGLRIQSHPDPSLPGSGASRGDGNFVLTHVAANLVQDARTGTHGRFIRIELPGKDRILSLAEVEVYSEGINVAKSGTATQSSEILGGAPSRAIDGKTSGEWQENSVTHTATSESPWWLLDLGQTRSVDALAVWNRTDNGLMDRLSGAKIQLLDENRNEVWQTALTKAAANHRWSLQPTQTWKANFASADYSQSGFAASNAIDADPKSGWAVGGDITRSHALEIAGRVANAPAPGQPLPFDPERPLQLRVELAFESQHPNAVLSRFSLGLSTDPRIDEWLALPGDIAGKLRQESLSSEESQSLHRYYVSHVAPSRAPLRERRARLQQELDGIKPITTVPVLRELAPGQRRETKIQLRGNYRVTGDVVQPGFPVSLAKPWLQTNSSESISRLELARWLVSRENPLTARVLANRIWESIFGTGIVRTSEEFGSQGDLPTHPELLDYLALDLMEGGWDLKRFIRSLVLTAAYQQRSAVDPKRFEEDPENSYLSRGPRFRVAAEQVRDMALASAGLLSRRFYGPPTRPPQPSMGLSAAFGSRTDWETSQGEDRYRRALYTQWRRSNPYPAMATFDAPNREVCVLKRDRTNTPLQALVTLNDPVFMEAAQGLARRVVLRELPKASAQEQIVRVFELAVSRPPSAKEIDVVFKLLSDAQSELQSQREQAMKLATDPLGPLPDGVDPIALAAWSTVCNIVLNLDEFLMTP